MSIEIFIDSNFSGATSGRLDKDSSYVGDFWNDKISSVKIYSGTWEFFEDVNYQGRSFRLNAGNYPVFSNDWNDVISSFKQVGASPAPSNGGIAQRILDLTNVERSRVGSSPLSLNSQLMTAAQTHTDLMIKDNQLSHQLPGEPSLGGRISQTGYKWSAIAENIAQGYHTPESVVSGWVNHPGHRENLLSPQYQHLGVGYGNDLWTQDFGKS
ncbi:CAP domain-containing protein [Microseira wollei]|uniref:SCP-like extracellular n=1 Tax=Microseira wollei NIES-4236 TaxID=2530354 RepID=A0AAV3X061_9CYAN|nr:CAP domain-containing protein [Microseira wollei]GET35314.1 SCP-like extracellular [Microseira wollei NIES-4236]